MKKLIMNINQIRNYLLNTQIYYKLQVQEEIHLRVKNLK